MSDPLHLEAERRLRAAMEEYGFTDRDRILAPDHIRNGTDCWCHPEKRLEPRDGRLVVVLVHKEAS